MSIKKNRMGITEIVVSVNIFLNEEQLAFIEKYYHLFVEKGGTQSFEKFISFLLEIGSVPHLKRQAAYYVGGEIID